MVHESLKPLLKAVYRLETATKSEVYNLYAFDKARETQYKQDATSDDHERFVDGAIKEMGKKFRVHPTGLAKTGRRTRAGTVVLSPQDGYGVKESAFVERHFVVVHSSRRSDSQDLPITDRVYVRLGRPYTRNAIRAFGVMTEERSIWRTTNSFKIAAPAIAHRRDHLVAYVNGRPGIKAVESVITRAVTDGWLKVDNDLPAGLRRLAYGVGTAAEPKSKTKREIVSFGDVICRMISDAHGHMRRKYRTATYKKFVAEVQAEFRSKGYDAAHPYLPQADHRIEPPPRTEWQRGGRARQPATGTGGALRAATGTGRARQPATRRH